MQTSKKILIGIVSIAAAVFVAYIAHWLIRYHFYNSYRDDLSSYGYEEGHEFQPAGEGGDVAGMELAAENETLKLYANVSTGEVAVVDKRNGQITYSNPVNADQDAIANKAHKNYLKSQLIIDYFNTGRTMGTFDSFSYCTDRGQLEVEGIENGIRFWYTIGDLSAATGIVPQYISAATLERVLAALDDEGRKYVQTKYRESSVADDYYELLEAAAKGASQIRKLNRYFEEAGFTEEEYMAEMMGSGVEGVVPISFEIPLEYRLNGDAVDVSIPMNHVVENGGGTLFRIQMLRYFGTAGVDESGYMLVPNGSGSLINFNNGKSAATQYSEYVYGIDPLAAEYTVRENTENAKMALFGIFREESAIFATIEDGASFAYLTAYVSGKINEYNFVYPTFVVRGNDRLSMFGTTGNEAEIPVIEPNYYDANITVKYTMLPQEKATYAQAANYYRERLVSEGKLTADTDGDENLKFYYDVLGGVTMTKFFLGTQYNGMYTMTDFDQAAEIYEDLKQSGITSQVMNFQGWMNHGYHHDVVDQIKIPGALGGKSGLEELNRLLAADGNTLYGDVAFQEVSYVSRRYSYGNESSRYYGAGYVAELGLVHPATLRRTSGLGYAENHYFLISPKFLVRYVDAFTKKIEKIDLGGISLRDLGSELHSDKKRTNIIDREAALDVVLASLGQIRETGRDLLINAGNDYSFAYADDMINVPLSANDYYIVDSTVPFYEMLIHGYIDYAGGNINLSDTYDRSDIVLNLVEYGASPHFMFTCRSASDMKNTGLNRYYATTYENWKEDAVAIYTDVNNALKHVSRAAIIDHQVLEGGVKAVTYSNGVIIYINEGQTDQKVGGVTVPARSYEIGGVE
ncbi:MAG: hypothetical protein HFH80_05445 [Lachnospiraceae bacterium]|nr:hypothetical protein [Lachnospiraceae bacterium]